MRVTALSPLQPQFPAVGHLFRIGAVPFSIADQFVRAVEMKITTELPIYNPELGQYVGSRPPKEHMPKKVWANDGEEAMLIHGQLMELTEQQCDEECRANFQQYPPSAFVHSE